MIIDLIKIAGLCLFLGVASIPLSFNINSSPLVVWVGNGLGSLVSAGAVIYIFNHLGGAHDFNKYLNKIGIVKKTTATINEGTNNKNVVRTKNLINKHGLRLFSLLCPLFPGVLVSTTAVYLLDLDKKLYIRWMFSGVFFISGFYVLGYWFVFVR